MTATYNQTTRARAIALAGIFQAAALVRQTGQGKMRDEFATRASIASILKTDAASVEDVFGGIPSLRVGLETLATQLGGESRLRDMELTGYAITLMHLERKLARDKSMLDRLSSGIGQIGTPSRDLELRDPALVTELAELYRQTISTLTPRVMVHGDPGLLSGTGTRNMIRALLLAGIRSAVLWRQCGGNRWRLIFGRKGILESCAGLLSEARLHGVL
jgi:high frequency lysogenization protein